MKEIIKDCPWDHFGTHTQKVVVNRWWTNVVCSCGAKGPGHHSKAAAIETWNTRAGVANNQFNLTQDKPSQVN